MQAIYVCCPTTSNCHVCGDKAIAHMHYGGICCYSCKVSTGYLPITCVMFIFITALLKTTKSPFFCCFRRFLKSLVPTYLEICSESRRPASTVHCGFIPKNSVSKSKNLSSKLLFLHEEDLLCVVSTSTCNTVPVVPLCVRLRKCIEIHRNMY